MYFAYKASKKSSYISTVTYERINWLKDLKKLTAEFISLCYSFKYADFAKLVELSKLLLLHLNPIEDEDIIKSIRKVTSLAIDAREELENKKENNLFMDLASEADEFLVLIHLKCKFEWERIKDEAGYNKKTNLDKKDSYTKNLMKD